MARTEKKPSEVGKREAADSSGMDKEVASIQELAPALTDAETSAVRHEDDYAEVFDETDVSFIVADLEEEVNVLVELKATQEAELAAAREKLSRESEVRSQLEGRVRLLEMELGFAQQLRRQATVVVQERKRIYHVVESTRTQFQAVIAERNLLIKKVVSNSGPMAAIQDVKTEVLQLQGRIADAGRLGDKLKRREEKCEALEESVQNLSRSLVASNNLMNTLKANLEATRRMVRDLRSQSADKDLQIEDIRGRIAAADTELTQTQAELHSRMEANERLEDRLRTLVEEHKAACAERDTARKSWRSLQDGAMRVLKRTGSVKGGSRG